jgi:hypothetical protein
MGRDAVNEIGRNPCSNGGFHHTCAFDASPLSRLPLHDEGLYSYGAKHFARLQSNLLIA